MRFLILISKLRNVNMLWCLQQMRVHGCIFCREWDGKTAHLNVLMLTRIIIVSYIAVQVPRTIIATLVVPCLIERIQTIILISLLCVQLSNCCIRIEVVSAYVIIPAIALKANSNLRSFHTSSKLIDVGRSYVDTARLRTL